MNVAGDNWQPLFPALRGNPKIVRWNRMTLDARASQISA